MNTKTGQGTRAVWAGEEEYLLGATQVPVVLSAAFGYRDMEEWLEVARGKAKGHIYTRNSNPTVAVLEEKVRLLEDAEAATSAASLMARVREVLTLAVRESRALGSCCVGTGRSPSASARRSRRSGGEFKFPREVVSLVWDLGTGTDCIYSSVTAMFPEACETPFWGQSDRPGRTCSLLERFASFFSPC